NRANPVGQIFSLAMMLRESFELIEAADLIEAAVVAVWQRGCRTEDLPEKGCKVLGTREMANQIADAVVQVAEGEGRFESGTYTH
ncbi:MAG: isocitrate/isopropylmalate family dehydrogenase, partial [Planctomycetaceae bacterium]